jgi:hypothetical protein
LCRPLRVLPLLTLLLAILAPPARAGDDDVRLSVLDAESSLVTFDLSLGEKPVRKILNALHDGVPTRVDYTLELWRRRSRWFDHLVTSQVLGFTVRHDPLSGEYFVSSRDFPARSFEREDGLVVWLEGQGPVELTVDGVLSEERRYYLAVEARIEPLGAEQVDAVEGWLQGDDVNRDEQDRRREEEGEDVEERSGGGIRGFLFGLILNLSGLGDTTVNGQSAEFRPESR